MRGDVDAWTGVVSRVGVRDGTPGALGGRRAPERGVATRRRRRARVAVRRTLAFAFARSRRGRGERG